MSKTKEEILEAVVALRAWLDSQELDDESAVRVLISVAIKLIAENFKNNSVLYDHIAGKTMEEMKVGFDHYRHKV